MSSLKQFQEEGEKEFKKRFEALDLDRSFAEGCGTSQDYILDFNAQQTTLAYELGKKEVEENLEESVWAKSYFLMAKDEGKKEMLEKLTPRIGMLRQWLNEERITDKKMVTSEDIKDWLGLSALNEE